MRKNWLASGLLALALVAAGAPALADDVSGVDEVITILKERGVIDEGDAARMAERNRAFEDKRKWMERLSFFGDLRARYEGFWWDDGETDDRHRLRYRFRFGAKADVNDYFDATFRISSDERDKETLLGGDKSRNQTLGGRGFDFDPDDLFIDQAYLTFHLLGKRDIPLEGTKLDLLFGKMGNMFRSKTGKDYLVWDSDITPEGFAFTYAFDPLEQLALTFHTAYFIIEEKSSGADPYLIPLQLRIKASPADVVALGLNLSGYLWRALDDGFYSRNIPLGNVPGGLSDDRRVDLGDLRGWIRINAIDDWPILVYGNVVKNFSAQSTVFTGKDDLGWGAGLEIGDKQKYVHLGFGFFQIESNALPPLTMTDSDFLQGQSNAEGWAFYGARQILDSTDLKFTVMLGDRLDKTISYPDQPDAPDRTRLQLDTVVKF
jgi:hypothetical protein